MKKRFALLFALLFSCTSIYAADANNWAGLNTEGDISVTGDIIANPSSVIQIKTDKTIDGGKNSLQGAAGSYFEVQGGKNFTFQNFGKLSDGTESSKTFSYIDIDKSGNTIKLGDTIYKTIDNSVNSFTSSVFALDNAPSASKITVNNSVFYNNTAGVVNNSPTSSGRPQNFSFDILNSYFVNNSSTGNGGAIHIDGGIANIENSVFVNNSSNDGGAIYAESSSDRVTTLSVKNSIFEGNTANGTRGGGAILLTNPSTLRIEDSVFTNNTAVDGGAIKGQNPSHIEYIKNSVFKNNEATNDDGGAISSSRLTNIEGSLFENNSAKKGGGAIWYGMNDGTHEDVADFYIKDSQFIGNESYGLDQGQVGNEGRGGAVSIFSGTNKHTFHISNTKFIDNESVNDIAGALFTSSNVNYKDVEFTGNKAKTNGGAIYTLGVESVSNFDNVTFSGNNAATHGGAIYSVISKDNYKNSTFEENTATYGGAIYIDKSSSTFDNVTFSKNIADEAGAIYSSGSTDTYINSTFKENTANAAYGAMYIKNSSNTFVDTSFTDNKSASDAGAIYANVSNVNVYAHKKDVIFSGNTAAANRDDYNAGNDIYFEVDSGTFNLNLNASEGKKVVFDGGIASYTEGDGKATININSENQSYKDTNNSTINVGNTGEIQFNNRIGDADCGFDINLYSGKLSIGQNAEINATLDNPDGFLNNNNNLNIKGNAILNTANDYIGEVTPKSFTIADNVNWGYQFDVDLAAEKADKIIGAVNGTGASVEINNLNFLKTTPTKESFKITYSDTNINGIIKDNYRAVIGNKTYDIKALNDADGSHLVIEKYIDKGGLAWAVHTQASQYIVDLSGKNNGIVDEWIKDDTNPDVSGNTVLTDLLIEGNNLDIISNTHVDGLIISDGVKLTLNDVNNVKGFNDTFVNNGTLVLNNTSVLNNAGTAAIKNNNGEITIAADKDILIDAGNADNAILTDGGNITLSGNGSINIKGKVSGSNDAALNINNTNVDFNGDITSVNTVQNSSKVNINNNIKDGSYTLNDGLLNFNGDVISVNTVQNGSTVNVNKKIEDGSYTLNNGLLNLNGDLNNTDFIINDGILNIANNFNADNFVLNGGNISTVNNEINNLTANNINIKNTTDFIVDVDLQNQLMDTLSADSASYTGGNINVTSFNYLSDTTENNIKINFANGAIKDYVTTEVDTYMNKIYKYSVSYDKNDGTFNFISGAGGSNNYNNYNPAVMASPVAAQLGGYLTQLNSYDEAFRNMDMYMLMTKKQRQAMKLKNKYAITSSNLVYEKTDTPYTSSAGWFRPYATFESVGLKNGPKVSNVAYGSYAGGESEMYDLGNGWDGILGFYAGYNGSHQSYQGNSIYQNGGTLGLVGMAYKGNFFTGLTVNAGANVGEASTMYGNDNFTMLMSGVATKFGYNFELAEGKFIIQPNYMMSYSFINTFDYTNAAGVSMSSDPLHSVHFEPGIKFIGNLKNGWQPYGGVSVIWNAMDKTQFQANNVALPELSIKPFVKYGIGLRKIWGDKFVGYGQAYVTNGGRNGIGLKLGFRWNIGKSEPKSVNSKNLQKHVVKK